MSKFEKMTIDSSALDATVDTVLAALRDPEASGLRPEQLQKLFAEVVTAFAKLRETDEKLPAFPKDSDVAATNVAIAATGILDAVDVAVFELGMWQTLKQ